MDATRPELGEQFIEVVKEQMRLNDPPETNATFQRLMTEGYPEEEVYRMLACVVAAETHAVLREQQPYNPERYVKYLQRLPTLPWE